MSTPNHYDPTSLAQNLRWARELADLTQAELAEKCGIPAAAISHFECEGRRIPSLVNLCRLCNALGCSPDELLSP